ncbi:hypothetical protein Glove_280g18 [Diversispora epigaea]|uniref:C3H1-type domain-containing protein n=1 Tax=Diversispora epigaea TaxID=1348612 RepID=A0A397I246_9GLOM|nr:hypothetical protein Glove_280g18 [Diversispora epigaea]
MHLRGNVYVQYSKEVEAEQAMNSMKSRWYAGKQLVCEYCPVTRWKPAICGYYERNKCPKGIQCNFLHVYRNPGNLYVEADKDFEYLPKKPSSTRRTSHDDDHNRHRKDHRHHRHHRHHHHNHSSNQISLGSDSNTTNSSFTESITSKIAYVPVSPEHV